MTNPNEYDPFNDNKAPSLSFKDQPIGTVHTLDVSEVCKYLQQRDFDTDEPAYWPANPGQQPKPKMAAVFNGPDENGEAASLWAPDPSDLFAKIGAAQKKLGRRIGAGDVVDRLHIKLADKVPAKNPKFKKNVFEVAITHPGPKVTEPPADDPFGDDAPPF